MVSSPACIQRRVSDCFQQPIRSGSTSRTFYTIRVARREVRPSLESFHDYGVYFGPLSFILHPSVQKLMDTLQPQNKSGAYEDRLFMKILAHHFDLITNINTSWLPLQEPFMVILLALISVHCHHVQYKLTAT